ncbi:MAG: hypothetical protein AB1512_27370 [Thermodesulfobacteriota bacterium]
MELARELYDFGAHAGSLEGYVYAWINVDPGYLPRWTENLLKEYRSLPESVLAEIQPGLDGTLGRAVRTIEPHLGETHAVIGNLKGMIKGKLPASPDDFTRRGDIPPGSYREIYEFAANAGAFEGYVYIAERADYKRLSPWAENLARQYQALPDDVRERIQASCDMTLGRALQSLRRFLDDEDRTIVSLKSIVKGEIPSSHHDFVNKP